MRSRKFAVAATVVVLFSCRQSPRATAFTTSYLDGQSWNTVYAQGFVPSLNPSPNPGLAAGDTVNLAKFEFFKSGNADSAANIRLAIINSLFADLTGLSTSSGAFVGLSTNTVASTAGIATGDPITFTFNNLPLLYGGGGSGNYGAVFVNENSGALTPIRVSALTANYTEQPPGSGSFHPATNYGTESQFGYATSNFISTNAFGMFFNTFSFAGDANFRATFVPEPAAAALAIGAAAALAAIRRRRAASPIG